MKVLLTGATGFLGSQLASALLKEGDQVTILKRSFSNLTRIQKFLSDLAMIDIDVSPLQSSFNKFGPFEVVIHTATNYGRRGESDIDIFQSNVVFPMYLLQTSAAANVPLFINTDTSLYADLNAYSLSKSQFAAWGRVYAKRKMIRFINIILEQMYGADEDETKFTNYIIRGCLRGAQELKISLGEQKRDFIYIDDVVAAFLTVILNARELEEWERRYEVGSGKAVTIRKFAETVLNLTGGNTLLKFGAVPYRESEVMFSQADTTALSLLGWRSRFGLTEGLRKTIKQLRVM